MKMKYKFSMVFFLICVQGFVSCAQRNMKQESSTSKTVITKQPEMDKNIAVITLGAGCFWCVEAVFQQLNGVQKVVSGYSGGHVENPSYEEVCSKESGHAEVCQVFYDTTIITLPEILEVYWKTHDPTTMNQQGADRGPQYRSVIFFHTEQQKEIASQIKNELDSSGAYAGKIITAIEPFTNFYSAESYHQNYYKNNPNAGYCQYVIQPKLDKFNKVFKDKLKKNQ